MNLSFPESEPVITAGSIVALIAALLAVGVAFGLTITTDQKEAILSLAVVLAPFAVAWLARPHVTPNAKVDEKVMTALGANGGTAPTT